MSIHGIHIHSSWGSPRCVDGLGKRKHLLHAEARSLCLLSLCMNWKQPLLHLVWMLQVHGNYGFEEDAPSPVALFFTGSWALSLQFSPAYDRYVYVSGCAMVRIPTSTSSTLWLFSLDVILKQGNASMCKDLNDLLSQGGCLESLPSNPEFTALVVHCSCSCQFLLVFFLVCLPLFCSARSCV